MDRDSLALLLGEGLSLEQIGRRFGREASTVGYWVKKHGLEAAHRERHAGRGGLSRDVLAPLIAEGLSLAKIARRTGFSESSVKYWLGKYGMKTRAAHRRAEGRQAKLDGRAVVEMECATHGRTEFRLEGRGAYRCLKCRGQRVADRRRRVKEILLEEAGGACIVCGYDRYAGALHFHHLDPGDKAFALGQLGYTRGIAEVRAEAAKCVLLCGNCHAEVEAGLVTLPKAADKVAGRDRVSC